FGLVQEGVTWFSDPGQGGPPDAQLEGLFQVLAPPPTTGTDHSGLPSKGRPGVTAGGAVHANGTCSAGMAGEAPVGSTGALALLAALAGIFAVRRRGARPVV